MSLFCCHQNAVLQPGEVLERYYQTMGVHDRFMGEIVNVIE